eukprot:jgi/Ulvmu1/9163/UM005_0261.1
MGTRQLQKLQGNDLLPAHESDASDASESDGEDEAAPAFNPFLLLGDEDDEPVSEEEAEAEEQHSPVKQEQPASRTRATAKKQKKAKQAKKGKEVAAPFQDVDIDAALKDLGLDSISTSPPPPQPSDETDSPFTFSINAKLLSPDEELRAIFGSSVLALEGRARRAAAPPSHRGQPQRSRQLLLSTAADLPRYDGSLSMHCLSPSTAGVCAFRIEPSSRYRTATLHFQQAQASMDPNNVAAMLAQYPFHVQSIITMADIYQSSGQGDYAGAMLNRALYALEGAWHPAFKACMLRGDARLPSEEAANGLMFAALARRVRALCQQGMHRTALEWAKLTLRLDEGDPVGMLFHMDYLALRAREYSFIEGLIEAWDGPVSLRLVPSYAFSTALAAYYAGRAAVAENGTATGVHEAGARPELDVQLINAITTCPLALSTLVKAMQDKDAAKSANWQSVMRRPVFAEPRGAESATLEHLCRIFAARHVDLWKAPDVLAWTLRCAEAAADAADAAGGGGPAAPGHPAQVAVGDAHALIDLTYPPSSENEFAHCAVQDYTDAVATLPPEAVMGGGGAGAAPPELEQMAETIARNLIAQSGTRQLSDEELQAANPIMALLQTLMPWVSVAGEAAEEAGQSQEDLLAQVPGLTAFLSASGVDLTRAVPAAERPRVLELVREYLMQQHGGGGGDGGGGGVE